MKRTPSIRLRPAGRADAPLILAWRNDPSAYRRFATPVPVSAAEHAAWFAARLKDPRSRIYLVLDAGRPVGQVRLDLGPRRTAELSLTLARAARGRGLGTAAILRGGARAKRLGAESLVARVLTDNAPSTVAFVKAGYRFLKLTRCGGREAYLLGRPV